MESAFVEAIVFGGIAGGVGVLIVVIARLLGLVRSPRPELAEQDDYRA
jgi:hypothetical protein